MSNSARKAAEFSLISAMDTNLHCHRRRCSSHLLQNIEEEEKEEEPSRLSASLRPPETPTETMEFLARSWSLSAVEVSKALTMVEHNKAPSDDSTSFNEKKDQECLAETESAPNETKPKLLLIATEANGVSPPISPRVTTFDVKGTAKGKTMGGWLKDHRERRKAEDRCRNAQVYAATSVAGVAAAVAAVVAGTVFPAEGSSGASRDQRSAAAIASAAALVASHCVEMAQTMGATHDKILGVINSAVQAQTCGDIMALTAGAATALRGAATLRARLQKEIQGVSQTGERSTSALAVVSKGGELLKRTRKGVLHWKQVSVYMSSNWQVIIKTKSTHMAGTFVKQKKSVVVDVCSDIPTWPGREVEDGNYQRAYFGIKTPDRLIEFECKNKSDKQTWIEGIKQMLDCHANMTNQGLVRSKTCVTKTS